MKLILCRRMLLRLMLPSTLMGLFYVRKGVATQFPVIANNTSTSVNLVDKNNITEETKQIIFSAIHELNLSKFLNFCETINELREIIPTGNLRQVYVNRYYNYDSKNEYTKDIGSGFLL
ncbi:hypothetical protein GTU79_18440 [Sodalis ligni]|uniref:hypothetical protein n=1 Tax=Sodalis ligni TaxID=2697027 RepID=UPI001BDE113A|nr:hypothetical protein [Sodalis ligni]QWA09360.1 hypothetical protein GTU79_18440 [Sodalis ligni]